MAGQQIDELPHITDKCNTKTGLKVFLGEKGEVTGYCFACKTYIPDPYEGKEYTVPEKKRKTPEEIEEELNLIKDFKVVDVPSRKLRKETLERYEAKVSLSEYNGVSPTAIYWPLTKEGKITAYHVKGLIKNDKGKSFVFNIGDGKECDLIGWEQAKISGAYKLIITEGPEDMASVNRIFEMYGKAEYQPAVVSLPAGVGSTKKVLQKHSKDISRLFKEIVFCFDNDVPGQEAVKEAMLIFPKGKSVTLPAKDANECLIKGVAKAAYVALAFQQETPKNTHILRGSDIHLKAREPAKFGELTWPFPALNEDMRGIRLGETAYIGAG